MEGFKPVLFGWTTTQNLWPMIHPPLLLGWGPLCLAPRWKHTKTLTLAMPFLHGILYSSILLPMMMMAPSPDGDAPQPDLNNMESIFRLFANPDVFFCGWVHYLAFDLLVARGIAQDALEVCKVSDWQYYTMVVPCLFGCFYAGPVGYVLYMVIRTLVLNSNQNNDTK
ncbi:expressed unknown protein [Seminavis robusta]|uniref:DUF4281 domain-containing protein n=1 Tax=Seminavis robusta TaxID=568900 RepID=A0A9N8H6U8_9STRA|nr:expressed unknown protein [Seminavis robusta]|eukprot:Sro158_g071540.1 n/a (168) ;mRNA; r:40881-41384